MPITMKALKDFRGRVGEGRDRIVEAGNEFNVEQQSRADDLERRGFAVPVVNAPKPASKMDARPKNKMELRVDNKAADAGPLPSPGGETGAETAPSSSPQGHQPRQRRSRKPAAGFDL